MTDIDYLVDIHKNTPRQGPGSEEETKKALSYLNLNGDKVKIADIGCGSGAQTLTLAKNTNSDIYAIDLFPQFLDELNEKSKKQKLADKIKAVKASMDDLPFGIDEFDIIWSEGAIYNIGFRNGIENWKRFLKPGGYLAVTEITWTTKDRPKPIDDHWVNEYP